MIILESTLTCPTCNTAKTETMPADACQFFYECTGCGALFRPAPGDCCVFCSYGSGPCPPIQARGPQQGTAFPFNGGWEPAPTGKAPDFHPRAPHLQREKRGW